MLNAIVRIYLAILLVLHFAIFGCEGMFSTAENVTCRKEINYRLSV